MTITLARSISILCSHSEIPVESLVYLRELSENVNLGLVNCQGIRCPLNSR